MATAALQATAEQVAPLLWQNARGPFLAWLDVAEDHVPNIAQLSEPARSTATALWAAHMTDRTFRSGSSGQPGQTTSRAGRSTAPLSTPGPRAWSTTSYGVELTSLLAGNTGCLLGV